jgi:hypothetical protein
MRLAVVLVRYGAGPGGSVLASYPENRTSNLRGPIGRARVGCARRYRPFAPACHGNAGAPVPQARAPRRYAPSRCRGDDVEEGRAMSEHSSTNVDSLGARVEDAVREGSDDRVREAREEAVERAADAGLPDAMAAPQDEASSIAGTGRTAATDGSDASGLDGSDAGGSAASDEAGRVGGSGGSDEPGVADLTRGGTGSPQIAPTTAGGNAVEGEAPVPASGRMGDATYGSGLAGGDDDDSTPATRRADRPEPGAEHLQAPAEARNPANESPATLGIDDTDTALADEDAT